jgi:hypothetical protein
MTFREMNFACSIDFYMTCYFYFACLKNDA